MKPIRLEILAQDLIRYGIQNIDFTNAKFNNYSQGSGLESSIVTSTDDFLITWKFRDVINRKAKKYRIRKLDCKPIDTQHQIDNDKQILVTDTKTIEFKRKGKRNIN